MNVNALIHAPVNNEPFQLNRNMYVPDQPGCYILTTFNGDILYIGRSDNLRRRMKEHLDDKGKTSLTADGRASTFYWLDGIEFPEEIEAGWVNSFQSAEGRLPIMNKIFPSFPSVSG